MASRYENNEIQKLKDGRRVYRTKRMPNIPKKDTDIYVATQDGDRYDTLAYQFYGDSSLHWIIRCANNIHSGDIAPADGTILRIPKYYLEILNKYRS